MASELGIVEYVEFGEGRGRLAEGRGSGEEHSRLEVFIPLWVPEPNFKSGTLLLMFGKCLVMMVSLNEDSLA